MAHRRAGDDVDDALAVQDEEVPLQCLLDPARPIQRVQQPPRSGFLSRGHVPFKDVRPVGFRAM